MSWHGGLIDYEETTGKEANAVFHDILRRATSCNGALLAGCDDVNITKAQEYWQLYQDTNGRCGWSDYVVHEAARCGWIRKSTYKDITGKDY